jgi:FkbM family methyltransferase
MLFNRIVAIEPDPVNFKKLASYTSKFKPRIRIELINKAVHIFNGKLNFLFNSNSSSAFSENSNCTVNCFSFDFFTNLKERCFIKIDIEGNEWSVLASSIDFIIAKKPILMISVYHKPTDLIDIYYLIASLEADYKFYLRSYGHDGADLVLYCVPSIQTKSRKIFLKNDVKAESLSFSELSNLNFEKFRILASLKNLSRHLKSGFPDFYRESKVNSIFSDIKSKLKSLNFRGGVVLEIGPGCSSLPILLADHCRNFQKKLIYIDSEEVLKHLPSSLFIEKVNGYFPLMPSFLSNNNKKINTILIYSVIQYIYQDNHLDSFLKAVFGLLSDEGEILIGDIPNISMRNRFLATKEGKKFSKKYSPSSKPKDNLDSINSPKVMDDNLVLNILTKARLNRLNAWIVPQNVNLPMANRREDILIKKP